MWSVGVVLKMIKSWWIVLKKSDRSDKSAIIGKVDKFWSSSAHFYRDCEQIKILLSAMNK